MRLYTRNLVFKPVVETGQDNIMVGFLELLGHVISNLTDRMEASVSNFWVWIFRMLNNGWHDRSDLFRVIDILTNLTESHNTSVLVPPVTCIADHDHDELTNQGQHNLFSNRANQSIDA